MSGRKKYKGERYSFFRDKKLGHGGNGAVYDVKLEGKDDPGFPVVAKFFEYSGDDKEKRYNRFKKEINALKELKGVDGILEVIDNQCPSMVPKAKDEAWYLMPKAEPYIIKKDVDLYVKLSEMLQLARIIQRIHEKGKAHRDIKPENILMLDDKMFLSDFGLCWSMEEKRLTDFNERVGPYKIMPPELESIQINLNMDYKASDVYLFAKVLWMTLKRDNVGFRGQYQRGEPQIYLNKEKYGDVKTLEPIHKLMEGATCNEMTKRISMKKCIEYLELQLKILEMEEEEFNANEFVRQLLYDEHSRKIIADNQPDEVAYTDKEIIYQMLKDIISISNIFVKRLHGEQGMKQIQVTDFKIESGGICKFIYYYNRKKVKEYLLNIRKMNCSKSNSDISLELQDVSIEEGKYIAYSKIGRGYEKMYQNICFSSDEKIIIRREKDDGGCGTVAI